MTEFIEQKRFVRDIKGAAASILHILFFSGRSLTGIELEDATGFTDKPIDAGLKRLSEYGLVQNNGHRVGWSLIPGQLQLWQGHSGVLIGQSARLTGSADADAPLALAGDPRPVDNSVDNSEICGQVGNDGDGKDRNFRSLPTKTRLGRPILKTYPNKDSSLSSLDLEAVISDVGITGRLKTQLIDAGVDADVLLGWVWWSHCQSWITSANGWAGKVSLAGDMPHGLETLAAWWRGLDDEDLQELEESIGSIQSHLSRSSAHEIAYYYDVDFTFALLRFVLLTADMLVFFIKRL